MFTRVKGTNDFIDLTLFNFIIDKAQKHLTLYHFTQIATPILEQTELFKRSLGVQTDVVSKEMFLIKTHDNDDSICLRPEATASTVRAFVENSIDTVPWKVFSYGPMFRYERPQKGRFRQFHQFNIEIIGSKAISQDVQCITMLDRFFSETLQLDMYALQINYLGCPDDRAAYRQVLKAYVDGQVESHLCNRCKERKEKNLLRIFDCKETACQNLLQKAPLLINHLCAECNAEWKQLQNELEMLSVTFTVKPTLVRGLDYYQKTVFEFVSDNLGAQNAFCGGGRYDQLVSQVGAKEDQPSIGAAFGIERVILLVEEVKDKLAIAGPPALHLIVPLEQEQQPVALLVADHLRAAGFCTDILFDGSMKSRMRKANKFGAAYVLLIGEDEQQKNQVMIKNMITGAQEVVGQIDVVDYLKK